MRCEIENTIDVSETFESSSCPTALVERLVVNQSQIRRIAVRLQFMHKPPTILGTAQDFHRLTSNYSLQYTLLSSPRNFQTDRNDIVESHGEGHVQCREGRLRMDEDLSIHHSDRNKVSRGISFFFPAQGKIRPENRKMRDLPPY